MQRLLKLSTKQGFDVIRHGMYNRLGFGTGRVSNGAGGALVSENFMAAGGGPTLLEPDWRAIRSEN